MPLHEDAKCDLSILLLVEIWIASHFLFNNKQHFNEHFCTCVFCTYVRVHLKVESPRLYVGELIYAVVKFPSELL